MANEVWIFFPESQSAQTADLRKRLRQECRAREWQAQERPARPLRTRAGELFIIRGNDAVDVYRRMHRSWTAVLSIGAAQVSLRARPRDITRHLRALGNYCLYKAFFMRLGADGDASVWIAPFERWAASVGCENEYDPRCLPLHVFASGLDHRLSVAEGRAAFDHHHGAGRRRQDDEQRHWSLDPSAYHGTDSLHVAGCGLPTGFHWDVRGDKRGTSIWTPTEDWIVSQYVNVSPDAHVRGRPPAARRMP